MSPNAKRVIRLLAGGAMVAIAIMCWAGSIVILEHTLVSWWIPFTIAIGIALPLSLFAVPLARKLTQRSGYAAHLLCVAPLLTGIVLCTLLTVNSYGAATSEHRYQRGVVVALRERERSQTRTTGRRTYTTGRTYKVYEAVLSLPSGHTISVSMPLLKYRKMHRGGTVQVEVGRGSLGWDYAFVKS